MSPLTKERIDKARATASSIRQAMELAGAVGLHGSEGALLTLDDYVRELEAARLATQSALECTPLMAEVFQAILAERKRQDAKWGADRNLHQLLWNTILMEEVGEVAEASFNTDTRGTKHLQEEVIQVAAVAVAYAENIIRGRAAARSARKRGAKIEEAKP